MIEIATLKTRWIELLEPFRVERELVDREFRNLAQSYSIPTLAYHNLDHVGECLAVADGLMTTASVKFAIWYHDIVYEPAYRSPFNEVRSAQMLGLALLRMNIPVDIIEDARRHILATSEHALRFDESIYTKTLDDWIMRDIDLWVLGSPPEDFRAVADCIRDEYAHVSDEVFYSGRLRFIEALLRRERIFYYTDSNTEEREVAARNNLETEQAELREWIKDQV